MKGITCNLHQQVICSVLRPGNNGGYYKGVCWQAKIIKTNFI